MPTGEGLVPDQVPVVALAALGGTLAAAWLGWAVGDAADPTDPLAARQQPLQIMRVGLALDRAGSLAEIRVLTADTRDADSSVRRPRRLLPGLVVAVKGPYDGPGCQLGHSSPRLVEKLYGHGDVGALEEIDRAIEANAPTRKEET